MSSTVANFSHLGNFPVCAESLTEVDVSGYDYWVTLGNFKKTDGGSPTQSQIDLSLENARKLFWDIYGLTGSVTDTSGVDTVTITNATVDDNTTSNLPTDNPYGKVCNSSTYQNVEKSDSSEIATLSIYWSFSIIRMLNGSEFIGYGVQGSIKAVGQFGDFYDSKFIDYASYMSTGDFPTSPTVTYETLSSIPFVKTVYETGAGFFLTVSLTALQFYTYT